MSEVIEIVAYNPDWPRMFEDENGSDFQLQEEYTRRGAVSPGTFVPVLILEGKCLHWRAKSAHLGGHLPLVWLDLYLSGIPEEEFAPPAPFAQGVLNSVEALPERPYTKDELRVYLVSMRQKCHTQLLELTDEQAHRPVEYPWSEGQPISFLELQLYNLRHGPRTCGPVEYVSWTARHPG